jgi:hypothetical protein
VRKAKQTQPQGPSHVIFLEKGDRAQTMKLTVYMRFWFTLIPVDNLDLDLKENEDFVRILNGSILENIFHMMRFECQN